MTLSLRTYIFFLLFTISLVFPSFARANTVCYPDGCATLNFVATRAQWDQLFGDQKTLAKLVETAYNFAIASNDTIWGLTRNSAGNITFIGCGNTHLHYFDYNCSYLTYCSGKYLVDYCGNQTLCVNGCADNHCLAMCPAGEIMVNGKCLTQQDASSSHIVTECPTGYTFRNGTCVYTGCPVGYVLQGSACIFAECPKGYAIQGSQCVASSGQCNAAPYCQGKSIHDGCTGYLIHTCDWQCQAGNCVPTPAPGATLSIIPSVVHPRSVTTVSWTSQNASSCTVSGTNGDHWATLSSNGTTTRAIYSQTTYTLNCKGYPNATPSTVTRTAQVTIAPTYQEK